jgi:hypothetical protein
MQHVAPATWLAHAHNAAHDASDPGCLLLLLGVHNVDATRGKHRLFGEPVTITTLRHAKMIRELIDLSCGNSSTSLLLLYNVRSSGALVLADLIREVPDWEAATWQHRPAAAAAAAAVELVAAAAFRFYGALVLVDLFSEVPDWDTATWQHQCWCCCCGC